MGGKCGLIKGISPKLLEILVKTHTIPLLPIRCPPPYVLHLLFPHLPVHTPSAPLGLYSHWAQKT